MSEPYPVSEPLVAHFDVTLDLHEVRDEFIGWIRYNSDLFEATTITRMIEHFQVLLEGIVADPHQRIGDLPLLTPAEREQLLIHGNATQDMGSDDRCVHTLFEEQVCRTPDAIAVVYEGRQLTYRQLNEKANQLAHYLQAIGVGPEVLVGLCVERSLEMLVGLLGILKAGGAYVPYDPACPPRRLAIMLGDAHVPVLLTQEWLRGRLPIHGAQVVCLDTDWPLIARQSPANPLSGTTAVNAAYVIYTSGSTGRPNGVVVEHRALANYTVAAQTEFALQPEDRVLQFASLSFDAAAEEIYPCLVSGATLVVRPPAMLDSQSVFLDTCRALGLTVLDLPTAFWHDLVWHLAQHAASLPASVRLVVIGGEALHPERLRQWRQHVTDRIRLLNTYGPTETTVAVTLCDLSSPPAVAAAHTWAGSIGRPLRHIQAYVLNEHLQLAPISVPGELYIGGASLARGYLNRPDLTTERFIPHPFSDAPGARLYKTGDRACYRPDGQLEYLGRIDDQVKIRGMRVEPGEIEAVLVEHPSVREAAVVAREDAWHSQQLVAYVGTGGAQAPATGELRSFLHAKLPAQMVPASFVVLDAWPLTPSGKLDRKMLPAPEDRRSEERSAYVAPRDAVERQLATIWEGMLGIQPIGITDNFFDLGGHSLLAVRLFERIARECGRRLPLGILFEQGTIEHIAALLRAYEPAADRVAAVAIQPEGAGPPFFCAHPFNGIILYYRHLARYLGRDHPVYGLEPRLIDDGRLDRTRVEDMAADCVSQIRRIQPVGPYYLGGYSSGGVVAFEIAQQLRAQGETVALLALFDTYCLYPGMPITAASPPLPSLRKKLSYHKAVWLHLRPRQKLAYAWLRAEGIGKRVLRMYQAHRQPRSAPQPPVDTYASPPAWLPYTPQIYPGHITFFCANEPPVGVPDTRLNWRQFAADGLEVHVVPGDHYAMLQEPAIARHVATMIDHCLRRPAAGVQVGHTRSEQRDSPVLSMM
ncbi:MAG TPA: amino acid adenylation domain-containing protein [Chloroflexota bacterium]|nr:amino acid adenylation domain-containing protein [Chloroflexota bacterium]